MNPTLIVDCSIAMAWCFADESTVETAEVQNRLAGEAAIVPSHWPLEVANVLLMAERRQRISAADASAFLGLLATLDIRFDPHTAANSFGQIHTLARNHKLTSYDAAYLELAVRTNLPLASLDDDLRNAAASLGVALLGK